ncbi:MAG: monovalent cation/H+ antiporter subunit D family protein, partial [Syntrophaceae bacterium]|nr:monovalent cation/H+ antiporter subunit D family protein [Syntrophaceae bacterium]
MNALRAHAVILTVILPLISSFTIPLVGWRWRKTAYFIAQGAIGSSMAFSLILLHAVLTRGNIHYPLGGWLPPWGIELAADPLNAFLGVVVSGLGFLVSLASRESVEKELPNKIVRFYTIYLLLFTGLMGMVVTGDVFNLYVFLEIASLAAYALIALGEDGAPLASFNYIILVTIGACLYLLGVGYLYIMTGSLNIADLARLLPPLYSSKVVRMALAFFLIGLFIKMGVFPLHVWLPDAYTYAPSAVSALIAPLMTKVAAYVLMRIVFTVFDPAFSLRPFPFGLILGWLAAAGILVGSVLAIAQSDFKRMLAYSSVSQMGYILLGISLANVNGFTGALLHILNHGFMKAVLFLVAAALMYKAGSRNIYRLSGLHRKMPLTSAALAVGELSMVGIPPTCGFFSKWYLLLG